MKSLNVGKCALREEEDCFRYFYDSISRKALTYGLMSDKTPCNGACSVAATGFALAAMAVGAQSGYGDPAELDNICSAAMDTLGSLERKHGFFYHFYGMDGGQRLNRCELSSIDTALLIAGAVTAGEYFGGETKRKAYGIYDAIDWNYFVCKERNLLYMAQYDNGFSGYWDYYAEQLILYVLGCGAKNPEYRLDSRLFYTFCRNVGKYGEYEFIYSWFGSLFTHQFSHAFIDFYGMQDASGVDWFDNSVTATKAARQFCIDNARLHKGYGANSWGLTSCCSAYGYEGRYGSQPSGNGNIENISDGTVAPAGAIGSYIFTPELSDEALRHYASIEGLSGKYGLYDAFNADKNWIAKEYVSIDKGISLLSIANARCGAVHKYFGQSERIRQALARIGIVPKGGQ